MRIVSGGQTGADRAALDAAIEHGVAHGGWCPRGRLAEDGRIADRYLLRETPSADPAQRTQWNVRDSDATVVFSTVDDVGEGTLLTLATAERLGRPLLHLRGDLGAGTSALGDAAARLVEFVARHDVRTLNVAGPRASQDRQVAGVASAVVSEALRRLGQR